MVIKPYNKENHSTQLYSLIIKRNLEQLSLYDLPEFGLVAFQDNNLIAAGFLRKVEGNYAMMDSYITDPEAPGMLRHEALDRITAKLITISRANNINALLAFSKDLHTIKRAEDHRFLTLPEHKLQIIRLR